MVLDEEKDLLYVIRALEVLMSSGIGLEGALHHISLGGYGKISDDFSKVLKGAQKGKSLSKELRALMDKTKSKSYRRMLSALYNNLTQNTDIIETLKSQGMREEEERSEKVSKYIEQLSGLPETLLIFAATAPIILSLLGLAPQLMGNLEGVPGMDSLPSSASMLRLMNYGLSLTIGGMAFIGWKAHSKDPGV